MNYLDYETTKLLPEINTYQPKVNKNYVWVKSGKKGQTERVTYRYSLQGSHNNYLRDAWSFEDVRLYLRDKGYEFYVTTARFKNDSSKTEYKAVIDVFFESGYRFEDEVVLDNEYYSFEECRLAAIQYCLNLINNEKEN